MKIKVKLVILFTFLAVGINAISFLTIYVSSSDYNRDQFYSRLSEKAVNTAKLLVDVKEINPELLRIIDENTASLPQEQIVVFNYRDELIYASQSMKQDSLDVALLNKIRIEGEVRMESETKRLIGILYTGEFDRFVVIASASDKYGLSRINNLRWVLLIVFIITIFVMIVAGWFFVTRIFSPINRTIEEVNQITEQSLNRRLEEGNGKDELAHLAQTFNRVLNRLESAFITQKGFVSYASHELRTPLTAILGQIEVTLMSDRSDEEYRKILVSINEELLKLKKLTNGLLRLFQLQSNQSNIKLVPLRIDEAIFQAVQQVKKERPTCEVEVEYRSVPENDADLKVPANEDFITLALGNLIDNAVKFSSPARVHVLIDFSEEHIEVDIIDQGIGIDEKEMKLIFDPFFRSSKSASVKGYGIGLALTKQILNIHQAEITVFHLNPGTRMNILFPKA